MPIDPELPAWHGAGHNSFYHGTLVLPEPLSLGDPIVTNAPAYEGDPLFFQTGDGGDVQIRQGEFLRSGVLRNAVYLSLFGGNIKDTGVPGDPNNLWMNLLRRDPAFHFRGQTQRQLEILPMVSANLPVLASTMKSDLQWMLDMGICTSIDTAIEITGPKRARLVVQITVEGVEETFEFFENWNARS